MSGPRARDGGGSFDFEYVPVATGAGDDDGQTRELVVAMASSAQVAELLRATGAVDAVAALDHAPIHWYRLTFGANVVRAAVRRRLIEAGLDVRYVASFHRGGPSLGGPMSDATPLVQKEKWKLRAAPIAPPSDADGSWFLGPNSGVNARSTVLPDGAGTRLAVLDDDAQSAELLELDAEVPVGITAVPRSHTHGSLMVAWSVGARGPRPMAGVAPAASPRLYVMPKPGREVLSLAVALARAVLDGADVIVCATYVESSNSPMLHDALTLAMRFGRDGRGTPVVFPTGREASSPAHSANASWSLSLGDPACDARVFCISPGARDGGWFVWQDRRGRWHPFANRGPAVRWLAPGDDIAYPFGNRERLFHAESSGASAIAAGVLLRVVASNPTLRIEEIEALVTRTATDVGHDEREKLHAADAAPLGNDADGHSAKHGYGRMNTFAACASASDPIAAALVMMGEVVAAERWLAMRAERPDVASAYSTAFARWSARAILTDSGLAHGARTLVRHLRLIVGRPLRADAHVPGAMLRHVVLALEGMLFGRSAPVLERRIRREVEAARDELIAASESKDAVVAFEEELHALAQTLFATTQATERSLAIADAPPDDRASGTRLRGAAQEPASSPDLVAIASLTPQEAAPAAATAIDRRTA